MSTHNKTTDSYLKVGQVLSNSAWKDCMVWHVSNSPDRNIGKGIVNYVDNSDLVYVKEDDEMDVPYNVQNVN